MIMGNTHIVDKLKIGLRNYLECFNDTMIIDDLQEKTDLLKKRGPLRRTLYQWAHERGIVWEKYFGKKVNLKK